MDAVRFDCAEVDDHAGLFVLDALTVEEAAAVAGHLATCDQPHESFAAMAAASGALADSVEPVMPPADLRARVLAAVAVTPQVPDDVAAVARADVAVSASPPVSIMAPTPIVAAPEPVSIDAARERRGPSRLAWIGLAAAAAIVIAALGAWNVTLQRQVSDAQDRVASLQQEVVLAQRQATDAAVEVATLQTRISDTQAQLTAAIERADSSDAQLASLRGSIEQMQAQVVSYEQQIAAADGRILLIGQAVAAATAPGSNVATLMSTEPGVAAAGMAIFPASGPGFIMVEGLPEIASDQTYQAWYGSGDQMTSAGLVEVGPHGLAIVGDLDPVAGTDTVALTVEPAGGGDQPTSDPIVIGTLPVVVGSVPAV
jgi:hypothetical protein